MSGDRTAFSNGTEGYGWMANWCDRCLRDAPFRNTGKGSGCPILLKVLCDNEVPPEWLDGPRDEHGRYSITDQYHCIEFRAPGSGSPDPRPKPNPQSGEGLFPAPERSQRRLTALPEPQMTSGVSR